MCFSIQAPKAKGWPEEGEAPFKQTFILTTTLSCKYYYPHFTDEETEAQSHKGRAQGHKLVVVEQESDPGLSDSPFYLHPHLQQSLRESGPQKRRGSSTLRRGRASKQATKQPFISRSLSEGWDSTPWKVVLGQPVQNLAGAQIQLDLIHPSDCRRLSSLCGLLTQPPDWSRSASEGSSFLPCHGLNIVCPLESHVRI